MIRRSRDLLALAMEHSEYDALSVVAAMICDGEGCNERVLVRAASRQALEEAMPVALEGWTVAELARDPDLCPRCTKRQALAA